MEILLSIPAIVWLIISALFFAAGEYLSKVWANNPSVWFSFVVVFVYALGSFVWLPALLHKNQLATMGTLWITLAVLATLLVGVLVFKESLSEMDWIGIILAILALVFLNMD